MEVFLIILVLAALFGSLFELINVGLSGQYIHSSDKPLSKTEEQSNMTFWRRQKVCFNCEHWSSSGKHVSGFCTLGRNVEENPIKTTDLGTLFDETCNNFSIAPKEELVRRDDEIQSHISHPMPPNGYVPSIAKGVDVRQPPNQGTSSFK